MHSIDVAGEKYFPANEVAKDLGISRQTLWRWRLEKKIPMGHRFRGRQVVFTSQECDAIREFANRIEPISTTLTNQLGLFNGPSRVTK